VLQALRARRPVAMPREAGHIKAGARPHATLDTASSPTPWYHAAEMESMKKKVEQHSQDLASVESSLCGLQRKITEKMNGLVQHVEALVQRVEAMDKQRDQEAATHARRLQDGLFVERLDTLAVSMTDLNSRFELLRSDTATQLATQLATFSVALEHQRRELGGKEFPPTDTDLQGCILKASGHVAHLEGFHETWREKPAMPDSIPEQDHQEEAGDVGLQSTQTLPPSREPATLPQSTKRLLELQLTQRLDMASRHDETPEPSKETIPRGHAPLHTSASGSGVGQFSPITSPRGSLRSVRSLGKGFVRKSGIVNSRIQHFEGRIQDVGSRATLPDGMQQMATLDAHLAPPEHFHTLQRTTTSPRGQTQITSVNSAPHLAATSPPWSSQAATTVQRLSAHALKAPESGGSATVQRLSPHALTAPESGAAATVQRLSSHVLNTSESGGAATSVVRLSSHALKAPESGGAATMVVGLSSYSQKAPESCGAATMVQRLSSYGQKPSESCGGSTYVSTAGESSEISQYSFAAASNRPPSSLDQDSLDFKHDLSSKTPIREEPQICLRESTPIMGTRPPSSFDQDSLDFKHDMSSKTRSRKSPSPIRLSFSRAANAVQTVQSPRSPRPRSPRPRSPPPLFTHAATLQSF